MTRRFTVALLVLVLVSVTLTVLSRTRDAPLAAVPENNPGHFVPSDVAQLAVTGRPQMVEVFHYG